jgi:hypothetical protein
VKANQALAKMSFDHERLRFGESLRSIGGEQVLHVVAAVDGVNRNAINALYSEVLR